MRKYGFNIIAFILGGAFFGIYLLLQGDNLWKFPQILLTGYFFVCLICFGFIIDYFLEKLPNNVFVLRLAYIGIYVLSPIFICVMIGGKHETKN